jgi:hypothetical protein
MLNTAWMLACRREARAFTRALDDPSAAQESVLREILQANADTEFGRRHRFCDIHDARAYQERVPPADYDAFREDIDRIAAGEPNVLSVEPVRLLEPTSGSTSARKLVPYTRSLRRQFQRMIAPWVYDLMRRRPALRGGRAYWSISPALGPREYTRGGIPIGFDDDASYLGGLEQWLVRRLLVAPAEAAHSTNTSEFQYATLLALLRAEDLALISIWSPTFLTSLLDQLDTWRDRLCEDLISRRADHRCAAAPAPGSPVSPMNIARAARRRSHTVAHLFRTRCCLADLTQQLWPRLSLISCWADASAAAYVPQLRELFPDVEIQPKGLLSTEGCVSLPLLDRRGAALALRSHFLEFEEDGKFHLAHELAMGRRYEVLLTTGGGLYRYRTGDIVEVVGFERRCPLVVFCGRTGTTSDLVGEKLCEPHVRSVLERVLAEAGLQPRFAMLVPVAASRPGYRLYLQLSESEQRHLHPDNVTDVAAQLDRGLRENPHYQYAANLRQLAPCEVRVLDAQRGSAWQFFERRRIAEGQRAGQIKPTALAKELDWDATFAALADSIHHAPRDEGITRSVMDTMECA